MFALPKPFRSRSGSFFQLAHLAIAWALTFGAVLAQADPVRIDFVPPPLEGTLSLGIYDSAGKLVRVLNREAENADFTLGDDGLRAQWDGNDDHGIPCPAGTYRAKGVAVGELGVEGIDFVGNDWVGGDDAPHLSKITDMKVNGTGTLFILGLLPGQDKSSIGSVYSVAIKPSETPGEDAETVLTPQAQWPPMVVGPVFSAAGPISPGAGETLWHLDRKTGDITQKDAKGGILRTLKADSALPAAVILAASPTEDKVFVLYENADLQRVRGYDFTGLKPGDAPKVLFENEIIFSNSYEQIASRLKFPDGRPFAPAPVLTVSLVENPLDTPEKDKKKRKAPSIQLRAQVDKDGAWIATADGLPLCKVTDTPNLRWAAFGRLAANRPVTFFASDGAAVEEYQISGIGNLMAFDAGTYPWNPNAAAPSPSASPTPSATPTATPAPGAPLPPASLSGSAAK